jgi:hypothetical protein
MTLRAMEHRVVRLDLSYPDKHSFAICEVFRNDNSEIVHYALNGACITAESPAKIASELDLMLKATEKPVLLESEMEQLTNSDIAQQLGF